MLVAHIVSKKMRSQDEWSGPTEPPEAGQNGAYTRAVCARMGDGVTRRLAIVLDDNHKDPTGVCQELHLASMIASWEKMDSLRIVIFCYVEPQSGWRRMILQSRAASSVEAEMRTHSHNLKQRILRLLESVSHFNALAKFVLDTTSPNRQAGQAALLKTFRPKFVLTSDYKDRSNLEAFLHSWVILSEGSPTCRCQQASSSPCSRYPTSGYHCLREVLLRRSRLPDKCRGRILSEG
jgi:hypothetical protein